MEGQDPCERKEKTDWHRVVIFSEGLVRVAKEHLRKGSRLYLEGQNGRTRPGRRSTARKWFCRGSALGYNTQSAAQLRSIVERIESLEEQKAGIAADIKDIYAEARGNSFDVKAIRAIIKLRKQDAAEREEAETVHRHTHGSGEAQILPNLRVLTGGARYGAPVVQRVLEV